MGGLFAYVLVFVLPEFAHMIETGAARVEFTTMRVIGLVGMLIAYVALAGVVAMLVGGADQVREAIAYGMGWEALAKGLASAGSVAVVRSRR